MHEIDYLHMMSYVLDDYGETYLKRFNNKKEKSKNNLFIWRNILKGGEWVINIKSVRNVLSGENFVYAFPEITENKIIVKGKIEF